MDILSVTYRAYCYLLEDESILWGFIARRNHTPATPVSNHSLGKPVGRQGGEVTPVLVKLEAVMGHSSVGRLGRRVLAQEVPSHLPSSPLGCFA